VSATPFGNIDSIVDATLPERNFIPADRTNPTDVEFGRLLRFTGWLVTANRTTFAKAVLRVGNRTYPCTTGALRPDIATIFEDPTLDKTGFAATVPTLDLVPGRHSFVLLGETESGERTEIGKPMDLILHDVRPDHDFFEDATSEIPAFQITLISPNRFVSRGGLLRIEGRAHKGKGPREIAATVGEDSVFRGHFMDIHGGPLADPDRFIIVVPVAEVTGTVLAPFVVCLDEYRLTRLALPPMPIVAEPPHEMVGVTVFGSPATGAARYEAVHNEANRIDRQFVKVVGYAYDPQRSQPGGGIAVRCRRPDDVTDPGEVFWGAYGLPTDYATKDTPAAAPAGCGFEVVVDRSRLAMGLYDVQLLVASADRRGFHPAIDLPPLAVDADIASDRRLVKRERARRLAYASEAKAPS